MSQCRFSVASIELCPAFANTLIFANITYLLATVFCTANPQWLSNMDSLK